MLLKTEGWARKKKHGEQTFAHTSAHIYTPTADVLAKISKYTPSPGSLEYIEVNAGATMSKIKFAAIPTTWKINRYDRYEAKKKKKKKKKKNNGPTLIASITFAPSAWKRIKESSRSFELLFLQSVPARAQWERERERDYRFF